MFNTNANNHKHKYLFHSVNVAISMTTLVGNAVNATATLIVLCGVGSICVGTIMYSSNLAVVRVVTMTMRVLAVVYYVVICFMLYTSIYVLEVVRGHVSSHSSIGCD